ncbi:MAG: DUF485 domain-containing protein [Bacteroidota bacterium]|nr:DUF485 domain-containing protein [Bacteroidota bacterium]
MNKDPNKIIQSEDFKNLVKKRWSFSITMAALMLVVYFGFLLSIAFNKTIFAVKLGSGVTIGIILGLGIICFAWIMTGIYVFWANGSYDEEVAKLKAKV